MTTEDDSGERRTVRTGAVFTFIGAKPYTEWLQGAVELDERGFILTGRELPAEITREYGRDPLLLETSLPGVFAVGDVRSGSVKRVASAVGEGSIVVQLVFQSMSTTV